MGRLSENASACATGGSPAPKGPTKAPAVGVGPHGTKEGKW